jgi:hypothetical protein
MNDFYGVTYREVESLLNPDGEAIKVAYDEGKLVRNFVNGFAAEHGLCDKNSPNIKGGDVGSYNRVATAISDFVSLHKIDERALAIWDSSSLGEWHRRAGGIACLETVDGFAILRPVKVDDSTEFGFGIETRDGGILSEDGYFIQDQGTRGNCIASLELETVLDTYRTQLVSTPKI